MFRKGKKKVGLTLSKRMHDERDANGTYQVDEEEFNNNNNVIKQTQKKRFKGLNTTESEKPPINAVLSKCTNEVFMYKDKKLEEYIQNRMLEEKIKLQNIQLSHGLIPAEIDHQKKERIETEQDLLYQFPAHLDVDTVANNREVIDKPI